MRGKPFFGLSTFEDQKSLLLREKQVEKSAFKRQIIRDGTGWANKFWFVANSLKKAKRGQKAKKAKKGQKKAKKGQKP